MVVSSNPLARKSPSATARMLARVAAPFAVDDLNMFKYCDAELALSSKMLNVFYKWSMAAWAGEPSDSQA